MRLLIMAMLATVCALIPVASAQTAGPTVPGPSAPGGEIKAAPAKAKSARRVSKKRVARRGGKVIAAQTVLKAPPRPEVPKVPVPATR